MDNRGGAQGHFDENRIAVVSKEKVAGPLAGTLVVELGNRIGAAACGSLLAQIGADVVLLEPMDGTSSCGKWANRPVISAGKRSFRAGADDVVTRLLERADIIIGSSDLGGPLAMPARKPTQITCDITAFGSTGPMSGLPFPDALVQALSGIADTTGAPDGPPTPVGLPILEYAAGLYAASGVMAALRIRRHTGAGQHVEVALYDCALSALPTFLPFHYVGKPVTRSGNRHSLAAPWNAYSASDGWVLICTATDDQWQRLCAAIGRSDCATADAYRTNVDRVAHVSDVDAILQAWVSTHTVDECVSTLGKTGIACGAINTVPQLAHETNLVHRGMVTHLKDPETGREVAIPGSPLHGSRTPGQTPARIPAIDEDRAWLLKRLSEPDTTPSRAAGPEERPCLDLTVVEIGQYTTAPLVARQLAAMGATTYKLEPPGGEGSRGWPPHQGDQGYFFTFGNSDKRSILVDLRKPEDHALFTRLLGKIDVLVENLKPGSLERLGFGPARLAEINPRLLYCGISGFGGNSVYPGRPAFDTVVQAMSGFMDLTRSLGQPQKAGISAADIVGGTIGLFSIMTALAYRDQSGMGQGWDISMQDAAAWVTQMSWNGVKHADSVQAVKCSDGYIFVCDSGGKNVADELTTLTTLATLTRDAAVKHVEALGIQAAPVLKVSEVIGSPQVAARNLLIMTKGSDGRDWPLLNCPMRLSATPARVETPIGQLGEANEDLKRWVG